MIKLRRIFEKAAKQNKVVNDGRSAAIDSFNLRSVTTPSKTIMAHDPSMTGWGWVIFSLDGNAIDRGAIKTEPVGKKMRIRKGDDRIRRITEINVILKNLIKKHNVTFMVAELPHGSQSAVSAVMVGVVGAVLQTISDFTGIGLEWFSEDDAKQAIAYKRSVSKKEMVKIVAKEYAVDWYNVDWRDQAVADAIAVFHVAKMQSTVLKYLLND